jgi:hypothetical protein
MAPATNLSRPIDLFHTGNHIQVVYARSKHYGRTGVITQVCNPRLSVRFDDGQPGSYVDYRYARLMPIPETVTRNSNAANNDRVTTVFGDVGDEEEDDSLVILMESLAIQTAVSVLAGASDTADVERAIDEQATRMQPS